MKKTRTLSFVLMIALAMSSLGNIGVLAAVAQQKTPHTNEFEEGYAATQTNGWTFSGVADGADISVKDGALTVSGIPDIKNDDDTIRNGLVQDQFAELSINPVSEGLLVIEAELRVTNTTKVNPNFNASKGLINILDSNGKMVANTYLSGRGATRLTSGGIANDVTASWTGTKRSWGHEASTYGMKYEIDFSTRTWKGYRAEHGVTGEYVQYTTTDGVNEFSFSNSEGADVAKIQFLLGVNGMSVDKIRIYNDVKATQTETRYNMTVNETKQARISYTPSTSIMGDMVWLSSNNQVATVSTTGLITAVGNGMATISAKSSFYGVEFNYVVTVDSATVVSQSCPYVNCFDDTTKFPNGYSPMKFDGFTTSSMVEGSYIESDGSRLVMHSEGVADRDTGLGRLELNFGPMNSGSYAVEVLYGNIYGEVNDVAARGGLFSVYSSDGTLVSDICANGRGQNGDWVIVNGAWSGSLNNANWRYGARVRYEINFNTRKYRVYQNDTLLKDTSTGATEFSFIGNDIAKFAFTLSNNGDYIDDIRITKNISATQTMNEYRLAPNDRVFISRTGLNITEGAMIDFQISSDNTSVATVNPAGRITAVGYGHALITVQNDINRQRFVFAVNVEEEAKKLTIDQRDRVIFVDESFKLSYSVPKGQIAGTVTWSSSNTNVATVASDGTLKGVGAGTAVITAKSEYGPSADYVIKVVEFDDSTPAINIKNAGFESNLYNWTIDSYPTKNGVWSSGGANNSNGCLKFTETAFVLQKIANPEPGELYTISYMINVVSLEKDAYASMEVESLEYDNVAGLVINEKTNGWKKVHTDFIVPKGCVNPAILIRFNGEGEVYYDDIRITRQKDITDVRLFSDGLELNSIVKNAPLTTLQVKYVPQKSGTSELVAAVYEGDRLYDVNSTTVTGANTITNLIDLSDMDENKHIAVMNWDSRNGMKPLDTQKTFLKKTQRSDVYNFYEINRMRGVYGGMSDIYDDKIKALITDKGINTLILNIIGTFYSGNVCTDMYALSKVMDDAEALSKETGVKIIPKISYGANATISNIAYGEFHLGDVMKNGAGEEVTNSGLPCPREREYWKKQVTDVLAVPASHKGIYGGVIDMEMYSGYRTSYGGTCKCDTCAADFDKLYGTAVSKQPITSRNQYLIQQGIFAKYNAWHKAEITDITTEVRKALHAINPDFVIGCMPTYEWISGVSDGLGTKNMPLMVFSENEYKGNLGFIYMRNGETKLIDSPTVHATGLWSTKNTGASSYIPPESFAAKAVEAAENSMGYWIYSSNYLVGTGNSEEDNAAYVDAIESANDIIDTKYGL